jgi:hypothetical protein
VEEVADGRHPAGIGRMFGAGTHFRGLKKPALETIMKHESPVVPDSGKEPLVLLQDHVDERCQQVGILCTKWDSQRMGEMRAQIVLKCMISLAAVV